MNSPKLCKLDSDIMTLTPGQAFDSNLNSDTEFYYTYDINSFALTFTNCWQMIILQKRSQANLEEFHDFDKSVIVSFLDLLHESLVSFFNEVVQIGQTFGHVINQMLLEGEAPTLDVVEKSNFERFHVGTEPALLQK